jgi:hypothetical protein
MSVKDRMAKDPVCGMKVDIVVGLVSNQEPLPQRQKRMS